MVIIVHFVEQSMDICKIMIIFTPCFFETRTLFAQFSFELRPRKKKNEQTLSHWSVP